MPEGSPKYSSRSFKHRAAAGAAQALQALERRLRPRTAAPPATAQQVLLLEYILPLGACVVMLPVFETLHRSGKTVIVATRGAALELLRHSPFVDHLIATPDPLTDLPGAARELRRQLKERGLDPDCALTGSFDQRSRIAALAALCCTGWRGGFTILDGLYQHPLVYNWEQPRLLNNLRLAELLGWAGPPPEPRAFFTAADADHAAALLAPLRRGGKPVLIAVTQTSRGQDTSWHHDRWVATLRHVQQRMSFSVGYSGVLEDAPYLVQLCADAGGVSLAGQTTLPQLAALLAQADLVLSVDTGTMHLTRAVGTPMVVMGPSWQKTVQWLPLGVPQIRVLRGPDQHPVPDGYMLDEVTVTDVIQRLEELAALYPADEQARAARVRAGLSAVTHPSS